MVSTWKRRCSATLSWSTDASRHRRYDQDEQEEEDGVQQVRVGALTLLAIVSMGSLIRKKSEKKERKKLTRPTSSQFA